MIYDRINYIELTLDSLPGRTHCAKYKQYFNKEHKNSSKHIHGFDKYDKQKMLTTHNMKKFNNKVEKTNYVIIEGEIIKLTHYERILKRNHIKFMVNYPSIIVQDGSSYKVIDIYTKTLEQMERLISE